MTTEVKPVDPESQSHPPLPGPVDPRRYNILISDSTVENIAIGDGANATSIKDSHTEKRTVLASVEGAFWATVHVLLRPGRCFEEEEEGSLSCAGVSGFRYWLLLYLLEVGLLIVASGTKALFSGWFVVLLLVYGLVRILMLCMIWAAVGSIMRLRVRPLVSICLFSTALGSLLSHLPLLPLVSRVGLSASLGQPDAALGGEYELHMNIVFATALAIFVYQIRLVAGALKLQHRNAFVYLFVCGGTYGVVRMFTVQPVLKYYSLLLANPPW